jgi:hypothetical protein
MPLALHGGKYSTAGRPLRPPRLFRYLARFHPTLGKRNIMPDMHQGPTDEDVRYCADLCQCIGYVVVHWSMLENQLDNCVNVTFNNCGGSVFQNGRGVPQSLKPKIAFLRRCFRTLSSLVEFRTDAVALLSRISSASKRRHELMHGSLIDLKPDPTTGAFRFRHVGYDGDFHTIREFSLTPNDFQAFASTLPDLVGDAIAFAQKLGDKFLGPLE